MTNKPKKPLLHKCAKPKKQILHITARAPKNNKRVNLYYVSIAQAAHFNPHLKDFLLINTHTNK